MPGFSQGVETVHREEERDPFNQRVHMPSGGRAWFRLQVPAGSAQGAELPCSELPSSARSTTAIGQNYCSPGKTEAAENLDTREEHFWEVSL